MTERYKIIDCESINVRKSPSINSDIVCTLKKGQTVLVVSDYSKKVSEINRKTKKTVTIVWYKIKSNKTYFYISSSYLEKVNYLTLCAIYADKVYNKIVELRCKHGAGANSYSQIKKEKVATCGTSVSAVMQLAGMLDKEKVISHTAKIGNEATCVSKKSTISKAILGVSNLKEGTCSIKKIGTVYSKMDAKYKEKGVIYVYDSTIGINAGGNAIYALLNADYQKSNGKYSKVKLNGNYYPFTHKILYAIIPNN